MYPNPDVSDNVQFWLITKLALAVDMIVNAGWADPTEKVEDDTRAETFLAVVTRALQDFPEDVVDASQSFVFSFYLQY